MTIAGILFDKDGTLLDYHRSWMPVNRAAALSATGGDEARAEDLLVLSGLDPESGRVRAGSPLAVWTTAEIAALWCEQLPGLAVDELTTRMDAIFVAGVVDHAQAVTDLPGLFRRLRDRGLSLGVATSDSHAGALASLGPFDVLELLDFVAGYDSGHGQKPGPGMVEAYCRATGLAPERVAVVGDNDHDLEMGRRAGAGLVIGVLTGTSTRDELQPLADRVLEDVTELEALLAGA